MALCAYMECRKEVDESKWHVETKLGGVMHVMCNTRYEASLCSVCSEFVDAKNSDAVIHKNKLHHRSCLADLWQNPHVQLTLDFGEV